MPRYCVKPRTRRSAKGCKFLSIVKNLWDKCGKNVKDTAT